jgi:hypothetical protein
VEREEWTAAGQPNPFSDNLIIRIAPPRENGAMESGTWVWRSDNATGDLMIYDIAGRVRARLPLPRESLQSLAAGAITGVSIRETGTWPSGIYLCRVRLGTEHRIIKLVLIR